MSARRRAGETDEEYRKRNRACVAEWKRKYPTAALNTYLKSVYGITLKQYEELAAAQGGRCAICHDEKFGRRGVRRFAVDHDHKTGKVRGLLCGRCNVGLGLFDTEEKLLAAVAYLATGGHYTVKQERRAKPLRIRVRKPQALSSTTTTTPN